MIGHNYMHYATLCYIFVDTQLRDQCIWRQRGNDIASLAAICAVAVDFLWLYTRPAL